MKGQEYYDIKYQKNHFGIYCIECIETNTKYIGQTLESFYRRWIFHKWNLKNNKHSNTYLQNAWNKYGSDKFLFYPLESFDINQKGIVTKYKLDELEQYHIKKYDTFKNGFNLTTGGEKCNMNPLSDEAKRKIGEKNRINMFGKKHTEETKRLMSESHKRYVKTESHRKHLSESLTGFVRSDEQKEKCRIANQGSKQKTAKYTEGLIEQIRIDYMNGINPTELSTKYNINRGTIYGIVNNARWRHVNPDGWEDFLKVKNKITTNK